jgi:endonuclease YncB( thermonuclease family)
MKINKYSIAPIICIPIMILVLVFAIKEAITTHITTPVICVDGDTFALDGTYYRLAHIDTPERGFRGYQEASDFTCDYLKNNELTIRTKGKDIYGRKLAIVSNNEYYLTLNELLVKDCYAIPFYGKSTEKIEDLYKLCRK